MVGANGGVCRYRRHAHGTEEAENEAVVEPRKSPRGIRTRMTGKKMSRVERKRKLSYRRPTKVSNE